MPERDLQAVDKQSTGAGILARLWWMFFGNVVLAFCILFIVENQGGFFRAADWVFWITLGSLVLVRYADIRFLEGRTGTGERASIAQWTRYAAVLTACAAAGWIIAHLANYVFVARAAQA
jgi:hypothetical protein